jgi:DNA-directed RNA polymerase specialized sigma24 family protein
MRSTSTKSDTEIMIEEQRLTNRLLAVLAIKGMEQSKAIAFLDSVGLEPRQTAAAIGITRNAVSIALHRMRKAADSPVTHDGSQKSQEHIESAPQLGFANHEN